MILQICLLFSCAEGFCNWSLVRKKRLWLPCLSAVHIFVFLDPYKIRKSCSTEGRKIVYVAVVTPLNCETKDNRYGSQECKLGAVCKFPLMFLLK